MKERFQKNIVRGQTTNESNRVCILLRVASLKINTDSRQNSEGARGLFYGVFTRCVWWPTFKFKVGSRSVNASCCVDAVSTRTLDF
jgi:hypothetical protein